MARSPRVYLDPDPEQPEPVPAGDGAASAGQLDWLTGPEALVAQAMHQLTTDYHRLSETQERRARWKVNKLRRDGWTGVRLIREEQGRARAWVPVTGSANLELANEARQLCRAFVGNLMADPPAPQVFPADTGAGDRDTSDVSERALGDLQSERRLNTPTKVRDALDTAATFGSGFIVYTVDPTGGGRKARVMQASPLATDPAHALIDPATGQPFAPMEPVLDPMGAPMPDPSDPTGQTPMMQPGQPPEPVERLVGADEASFTDEPQQAAYDWVPDLKSEVLNGHHVQLIPHTAENVWEAHGVSIGTFQSWKTVKGMFPEQLGKLPPEEVAGLLGFRPKEAKEILPRYQAVSEDQSTALVYVQVVCFRECADYPDGFYGIAVGGKLVPWRRTWVSYASGKREALLLPVSQLKLFRNGKSDPSGDGLMDDLGAMSEASAAQISHLLAYLDWFNNPTVYVPMHSTIQDQDILARKPIIRILPGSEPKYLTPPPYPRESMALFEQLRDGMQRAAHLMETAQGVEDPSVKSGRHAYQIVAQAHAQLSEPKQNTERCYIRCSEIELQYARAFGIEGDARWTGDDGVFKVKRWRGADLGGDVKLKPGTMTMLSPAAKAQLVEQWMGSMVLTPEEGKELLSSGIGAVIGLRDDPFKLEIRRQIARWEEGPPEGWAPVDPMQQIAQLAQQTGQPPQAIQQAIQQGMMPPPPPDPVLDATWEPRAHHLLPGVAQIRVTELAKLMATQKYHAADRGWQAIVEQEFQRMVTGAQPPAPAPAPGAEGGEPEPAPAGQGQFGAPSAGMPSLDNPALTGGQPGGAPAMGAPIAP